jgi:hypothetical protein
LADEEAQQLQSFHAAVAAQSTIVHKLNETSPATNIQEQKLPGKRNIRTRPLGIIVKVKPQAKRAKKDQTSPVEPLERVRMAEVDETSKSSGSKCGSSIINNSVLVSYSDDSDEE